MCKSRWWVEFDGMHLHVCVVLERASWWIEVHLGKLENFFCWGHKLSKCGTWRCFPKLGVCIWIVWLTNYLNQFVLIVKFKKLYIQNYFLSQIKLNQNFILVNLIWFWLNQSGINLTMNLIIFNLNDIHYEEYQLFFC